MRLTKRLATTFILGFTACATAQTTPAQSAAAAMPTPAQSMPAAITPAQQMAATVLQQRPATTPATCTWGYEDGFRLDGMAAMWHNTADPAIFNYIKSAVDPCIAADGTIV